MQLQKSLDITGLLKDGKHYAERRGDRVHIVDSMTGNTYVIYKNYTPGVETRLVEYAAPEGHTVWIEEGVQPPGVPLKREMTFHPSIIHLMCQKIAEGAAITRVCQDPDFPTYSTLRRWANAHPWIDEHLDRAKKDRGETFRDRAVEEAENAQSKDPIGAHALRVDTFKWAAGVDHEKYNPKAKIEATINQPTQIIVHTGIVRTPQREVQDTAVVPPPTPIGPERAPLEVIQERVKKLTEIPEEMRKYDE